MGDNIVLEFARKDTPMVYTGPDEPDGKRTVYYTDDDLFDPQVYKRWIGKPFYFGHPENDDFRYGAEVIGEVVNVEDLNGVLYAIVAPNDRYGYYMETLFNSDGGKRLDRYVSSGYYSNYLSVFGTIGKDHDVDPDHIALLAPGDTPRGGPKCRVINQSERGTKMKRSNKRTVKKNMDPAALSDSELIETGLKVGAELEERDLIGAMVESENATDPTDPLEENAGDTTEEDKVNEGDSEEDKVNEGSSDAIMAILESLVSTLDEIKDSIVNISKNQDDMEEEEQRKNGIRNAFRTPKTNQDDGKTIHKSYASSLNQISKTRGTK